jgi:hypothetical protein
MLVVKKQRYKREKQTCLFASLMFFLVLLPLSPMVLLAQGLLTLLPLLVVVFCHAIMVLQSLHSHLSVCSQVAVSFIEIEIKNVKKNTPVGARRELLALFSPLIIICVCQHCCCWCHLGCWCCCGCCGCCGLLLLLWLLLGSVWVVVVVVVVWKQGCVALHL